MIFGQNPFSKLKVGEIIEKVSEPIRTRTGVSEPPPMRIYTPERSGDKVEEHVAWSLRVAAAWSWRTLVVAAMLYLLGYLLSYVYFLIIPILVALLFAVLLDPINRVLKRRLKFPDALAATISMLVGLAIVLGLISAASTQIALQFKDLGARTQEGAQKLVEWLRSGPFGIDSSYFDDHLDEIINTVASAVRNNSSNLASGVLQVSASIGTILTGIILALFVLFFFLKDGRTIWLWFIRIIPEGAREPVHESAIRGWITLNGYVRAQIMVAAIDAVGIGLGAYFLGVPLAIPLGVLVFVGSFVPIIGAMITGSVAVLVALVDQGPQTAIIMLLIILAVQQIEGNFLQPWLMSSAVSLHPLAVLLSVACGSFLFGIAGAMFSVPIAAFVNTSLLYLHGYDRFPDLISDPERPGGPPGMLKQQILETYDESFATHEAPLRHPKTKSVEVKAVVVPEAETTAKDGGKLPSSAQDLAAQQTESLNGEESSASAVEGPRNAAEPPSEAK
ncbi:AI-2E family transporter [Gleimia sp. 6138-11-ORH1]|uniref:AI-2E family transporter n=1 Tax=Gleimia sp. 6138-11-ORH1 TaxID=2973937 RepID=UPI002167E102|nr:AI-2E family transporter [Gleimia sp. 6138-11-ORH1]MCS4485220.1 AI-2E family transporter [Gleimia sp. 6138-11-ORH1]